MAAVPSPVDEPLSATAGGALPKVRGRDFRWPEWQSEPLAAGPWDSVVLNSTGIGALTLAARLARSELFAGRVKIVGEPVAEDRRLRAGVTLRARSIDYYAAALGVEREALLQEIYGDDGAAAETHQQVGALCEGSPGAGFRVVSKAVFMDRDRVRRGRSPSVPLAYGVRNSRLRGALQSLALEAGMQLTGEAGSSGPTLREQALGARPLVVNATPKPLDDTPVVVAPAPISRGVAAAQMAFRSSRLSERAQIEPHSSFVAWVLRDGCLDMGVYYPFQDALSPAADYYGIFYRVVPWTEAMRHKAETLDPLEATVVGVGDAIGLEPVDREDTLGAAIAPVSPWRGVRSCQEGILDLSRLCGAGAPIITGDGMTRSAVGGLVAAESILRGRDPGPDVDRALRRYRQLNWELCAAMTSLARVAAATMRVSPNAILFRQTRSYHRDMWAGAY